MSLRVKVCCVASRAEARVAVSLGASLVGLVSAMPSGPGVIAEGLIGEIADAVPPGVSPVLLTAETAAEAVGAQLRRTRASVVQLVGRVPPGTRRALRASLPGVRIVQVVHVTGPEALEEALAIAGAAGGRAGAPLRTPLGTPLRDPSRAAPHDAPHALLLDSGDPGLAVPELGGTGRRHDWAISRRIVDAVAPLPVFLAGGLTPENVGQAVRLVRPFGVDVCSGVRTDGRLDADKLARFVGAAQAAVAR